MKKYIKENFSESILELITMIKLGEINKKNVEFALKDIENRFPNELVSEKIFEMKKPWNKKTLNKLWEHLSFSVYDKSSILHMSEIADEVYRPKRIKRNLTIVAVIGAIIAIIVILFQLRK